MVEERGLLSFECFKDIGAMEELFYVKFETVMVLSMDSGRRRVFIPGVGNDVRK